MSEQKKKTLTITGCVFHGPPPVQYASWNEWGPGCLESGVMSGLVIRRANAEDYEGKQGRVTGDCNWVAE